MLLSVCLTFALSADTQTVNIDVSRPVDTEQQFRINFLEYLHLPEGTELSSGELLSYDSSIVSGYTVPILQQNGYMKFSTFALEEPVSTTLVVELTTTSGETIKCNINVHLTGQYIVNITAEPQNVLYNGKPHSGYINLSGKLTFLYDDHAGTTRRWDLVLYGTGQNSTDSRAGAQNPARYVYKMQPSGEQQAPVRVLVVNADTHVIHAE